MNLHVGDLVKYVLENRKGYAFKGYSEVTIAHGIVLALISNTLLYAINDKGKICGVAVGRIVNRTMQVDDILTTERWAFRSFVIKYKQLWPTLPITGYRGGKLVEYNTPNLLDKFN